MTKENRRVTGDVIHRSWKRSGTKEGGQSHRSSFPSSVTVLL